MSIEFQCTQCSKTLKVPDEHAGKIARCPNCSAEVQIPHQPDSTEFEEIPPISQRPIPPKQPDVGNLDDAGSARNPYAPPTTFELPKQGPVDGATGVRKVEFDEIFSYSWNVWKNNLGLLVGVTVAVMAIGIASSTVIQIAVGIVQANQPDVAAILAILGSLINNMISLFLGIGQVRINLDLARSGRSDFGRLFSGGDKFLPILGATLIAVLAMIAGFALLIVPAIFLALSFWGYYFQIVDDRSSALDSFSDARQYCSINKMTTFVIVIAGFGISIVGILAFCVGVFFAAPLVSMMWAVAYLMMTNQISGGPK